MNANRNPQAEQMGDEAMTRTLAYQAAAIWPQEQPLFDRYALSGPLRILDVGCGTGEITRRLAVRYPDARLLGIDILESNLVVARRESTALGERLHYQQGDAFALDIADRAVDLVVCRHMSQAVPDFAEVLVEFRRVLKPGGWLHLVSEDYGMLHFPDGSGGRAGFDSDRFWNDNAIPFLRGVGCDGHSGRHSPALLDAAGFEDIAVDYVVVDTLRVPRPIFAGVLGAWRDGYAKPLADAFGRPLDEVIDDFNAMIAAVETPPNYALWQVPVVSGCKQESRND